MTNTPEPEDVNWDDPDACPFCDTPLRDGGAGFIEHIEETPGCRKRFEEWKENVDDDIAPEWSG